MADDDAPTVIGTAPQRITRRRRRNPSAPTRTGAWRADVPFKHRDGLKVTLRRERGVTPDGYLQVPFRFQAPPLDTYAHETSTDYPTFQTLRLGERPQDGGEQLERPAFDTLLSLDAFNWQVWQGSFNVRRMVDELHALRKHSVPLRLIVAQPGLYPSRPQTDGVYKITRVRAEDRGGEVGTQYVSLEFLEWPADDLELRRRSSPADQPRRHQLAKGDTLHFIAMLAYHQKSDWTAIARANGIDRHGPGAVRADSADDLAAWAKRHKKTSLLLPAKIRGESRKRKPLPGELTGKPTAHLLG